MALFRLDRLRERSNVDVIAEDVALEREAAQVAAAQPRLEYQLGNTKVYSFDYETCRGRRTLPFRTSDGRTVELDLISTAAEVREAYDAWRAR